MGAYIIRRLLWVLPIILGVLLITFFLFRVIGGNPAQRIAGKNATKAKIEQIAHERGYDKPYFVNLKDPRLLFDTQFVNLCAQLARLDFGQSQTSKQRVSTMLREGFFPSLCVTTPLFILELFLAISLALVAAYYRDSWIDRSFVILSVTAMSVSTLVYILIAQFVLASQLRWFPVWGFEGPRNLILPVLVGVIPSVGGGVRFYRTIMLDEMYQDYVRTARAKGVAAPRILFRHVLRNAMIPILTNVVIAIPYLFAGALLLENFFGIPGLGRMTVIALFNGDEDVIFASTLIGAALFVIFNLITDITYTWADPRIRLK